MDTIEPHDDRSLRTRFLIPVLVASVVATFLSSTVFQLVLLDMANSLNTTTGTVSYVPAVSRGVGVCIGLVVSFLSVKFKHKSLLLSGLVLSAMGALGNSLAPDVQWLAVADSFRGAGFVIIGAMALALIAEIVPKTKRGKAVGWIQTSSFIAYMIGAPLTPLIASLAGWRSTMSIFIFPFAVSCLILVFFIVPGKQEQPQSDDKDKYRMAYKQVLSNRCALGCILAYFGNQAAAGFIIYYVTFYRLQFGMELYWGSVIVMAGAIVGVSSGIISGRLLDIVGRKRLGVIAALFNALFISLFAFMPNLLSSVIFRLAAAFFGSMGIVCFAALAIEQVSEYKGTLTSLNTMMGGLGTVLGLAAGGFVLNLNNNYQTLMVMFGTFGLASTAFFLFMAKGK